MRKLAFAAAVGTLVLASAPSALAGPSRADSYYTVMCIDPGGNQVQAESVDARAIQLGGKDHAIDLFNANHPGWFCEATGPFTP
jgi:hypothetical protein